LPKARRDSRSLLRPSRGSVRLAPKAGRRFSPTARVLATWTGTVLSIALLVMAV